MLNRVREAYRRTSKPRDILWNKLVARPLAALVAAALRAHEGIVDLVLTGGEAAGRVLDELGIVELLPIAEVHHGAVQSRAPDGRCVVTRPGSFGGPDSLLEILRATAS